MDLGGLRVERRIGRYPEPRGRLRAQGKLTIPAVRMLGGKPAFARKRAEGGGGARGFAPGQSLRGRVGETATI